MNKTKVRSPNYPAISLAEAITKTKLIYDQEHKNPTDKEVIANHLGYNGLNGTSLGVISALVKYGLLEVTEPKQLKVTEAAESIFYLHPGDAQRIELLKQAALTPALFFELNEAFPQKLPSDQNLKFYLVKKDFNPRVIDGVIRAYRDTLKFINEEEAINPNPLNIEKERGDELAPTQSSRKTDSSHSSNTNGATTTQDYSSVHSPNINSVQLSPDQILSGEILQHRLTEDCTVRVQFSGSVTQEAFKKLIALLEFSMDAYPTKQSQRSSVETKEEKESASYWQEDFEEDELSQEFA